MLDAFLDAPHLLSPDLVSTKQSAKFAYLEIWNYVDSTGSSTYSTTLQPLAPSKVEDWACRRRTFAQSKAQDQQLLDGASNNNQKILQGGIRLLLAQGRGHFARDVPAEILSPTVLDALHLPSCTLPTFQHPSGMCTRHVYPMGSSLDTCERLSLVFRSPQKWEMSIGGLALTHDFATRTTTALSFGKVFDLQHFISPECPPPALAALLTKLSRSQHLISHILHLPSLFLAIHVERVRAYIMDDLSARLIDIEASIGITRAGRSVRFFPRSNFLLSASESPKNEGEVTPLFEQGGQMHRGNAKRLMARLNDVTTWTIFSKRSPEWDIECVDFLLGLLNKSERLRGDGRGGGSGGSEGIVPGHETVKGEAFVETLEWLREHSRACLEMAITTEARLHLQLNILYTSIAQDDGQTSARLATSAGKDSTSMKIIAIITAAYLPGTFIATLFSMGMFTWKPNTSSSSSSSTTTTVSPDFWIYWATTIPLTIITIAGWAIWWKFEEYRYERDVQRTYGVEPPLRRRGPVREEAKGPLPFAGAKSSAETRDGIEMGMGMLRLQRSSS